MTGDIILLLLINVPPVYEPFAILSATALALLYAAEADNAALVPIVFA
jgi:hypothetical protein